MAIRTRILTNIDNRVNDEQSPVGIVIFKEWYYIPSNKTCLNVFSALALKNNTSSYAINSGIGLYKHNVQNFIHSKNVEFLNEIRNILANHNN